MKFSGRSWTTVGPLRRLDVELLLDGWWSGGVGSLNSVSWSLLLLYYSVFLQTEEAMTTGLRKSRFVVVLIGCDSLAWPLVLTSAEMKTASSVQGQRVHEVTAVAFHRY